MYIEALAGEYPGEIVAWCEPNGVRMSFCDHFDLVNWWVGDVPAEVYARGALRFYGELSAKERGLGDRPERSRGSRLIGSDPFALDLAGDRRLRRTDCSARPSGSPPTGRSPLARWSPSAI